MVGILPPSHDETWVSEKRDGKIEVIANEWLKFGAHDDANMTLHHIFYRPRNDRKTWHVYRGVPSYSGPAQQIRAEMAAEFSYSTLQYSSRFDG